ncbi:DUF4188 domain-containing protein [Brachybacterium sp. YJGR34]|uniref:DUF4188 domain-containing protein n=1 Tax=Brachybacterium sp. YJGR34 TaxID=2059911 RepID=UPI000E0B16AD|nr:DUF4188 domain-containing protein [Brachybacterium sp. YJGR34]
MVPRTAARRPLSSSPSAGDTRPAPRRPPNLTHAAVDQIVVFHIGMTVAKPWRPDLWLPVAAAMPRMLAELRRNREACDRGEAGEEDLGFLGAESMIGPSGPWVAQYWRSTEHLYAYARLASAAHLPAWKAFNAAAREHPGAVGIWHETYAVPADGIETFYGNGAAVGLAKTVGTVPLSRRGRTARERLGTR